MAYQGYLRLSGRATLGGHRLGLLLIALVTGETLMRADFAGFSG